MGKFLSLLLCLALLISCVPAASAYEIGQAYQFDLSMFIENTHRRRYVEMMLSWYLAKDQAVQDALEQGFTALFFFEGCSDNMDDETLSDLSYYRVSAVCVAVRLHENGEPALTYFSEKCSTLPDRAHQYGARVLEDVGEVGPATILDGTYEVYSVRHGGVYEALHLRTSYDDATIPAVYLSPDGFTVTRATAINIHTRTGNHVIRGGMWSAGCLLVGDGLYSSFAELMDASYYAVYDDFDVGRRVGTVTINRQYLRQEMVDLYIFEDAVDAILEPSSHLLPETYTASCTSETRYGGGALMRAAQQTDLMTLPCSTQTDPRSLPVKTLSKGEKVRLYASIINTRGSVWYETLSGDEVCYVYAPHLREEKWYDWFLDLFK